MGARARQYPHVALLLASAVTWGAPSVCPQVFAEFMRTSPRAVCICIYLSLSLSIYIHIYTYIYVYIVIYIIYNIYIYRACHERGAVSHSRGFCKECACLWAYVPACRGFITVTQHTRAGMSMLIGLFCSLIGLFCSLMGLFCSLMGLFCS